MESQAEVVRLREEIVRLKRRVNTLVREKKAAEERIARLLEEAEEVLGEVIGGEGAGR